MTCPLGAEVYECVRVLRGLYGCLVNPTSDSGNETGHRLQCLRYVGPQYALHYLHFNEKVNRGGTGALVATESVKELAGERNRRNIRFLGFLSSRAPFGQTRSEDGPTQVTELLPDEISGVWVEL